MTIISFEVEEMAKDTTIDVKLNGMKEFTIRTWIAVRLINLAQWISWFSIEIEIVVPADIETFDTDVINTQVLNADIINVNDINYN